MSNVNLYIYSISTSAQKSVKVLVLRSVAVVGIKLYIIGMFYNL